MAPTANAAKSVNDVTSIETPAFLVVRPIFSIRGKLRSFSLRLSQAVTNTNKSSTPIPEKKDLHSS